MRLFKALPLKRSKRIFDKIMLTTNTPLRLCVIMPSHTAPDVIRLAVKSLYRALTPQHQLSIHLGFHRNYDDYCKDTSIFSDLSSICQMHFVEEIDWIAEGAVIHRYSKMHAKNIENLFWSVRMCDFDYLLILDSDIYVQGDFISNIIPLFPNADVITSLFQNINYMRVIEPQKESLTQPFQMIPKATTWTIVLHRRAVDYVFTRIQDLYSSIDPYDPNVAMCYEHDSNLPMYFDTFAKMFHYMRLDLRTVILPPKAFEQYIRHFHFGSFNYGRRSTTDYEAHIQEICDLYRREFGSNSEEKVIQPDSSEQVT